MKIIRLAIPVLCISMQVFSQFYLKEGYIEMPYQQNIARPFTYKNLAIVPLLAGEKFLEANTRQVNYTTLEEALKNRKVSITETENTRNNGAQVNNLFIENVSKDTIYIMAGEVVKGGRQDRVISDDMVLFPGSGKIDISVFCVEPNRWTYKSDRNFDEYYTVSSNSVRKKAAVDKNQSEVWQEVEKITSKQHAGTSTGTYAALGQSEAYTSELNSYLTYFQDALKGLDNCIGFVGISGDKIIGCDLFADPGLFEKQKKNLLNAYITEALSHGSMAKIDPDDVKKYLTDFLSDEIDQDSKIMEKGVKFEQEGRKVHINTY